MDKEMSYGEDYRFLPFTSIKNGTGLEVGPDLFCETVQIVNVVFIGKPGGEWVLADAGMPQSAAQIRAACERRFGENAKPQGIVLTHGHFDHVGAIVELLDEWDVPVYAHELEMPFLTGRQSYPSPDPAVEGGLVAKLSSLFPVEPVNLGTRVEKLPMDGSIPVLPEWRWIHTPGHTPGHISLFRERDRALVAGDAFVTVRQDSLLNVFTQQPDMSGPPRYLTTDWEAARQSVRKLRDLQPQSAIAGHGMPMEGERLAESLRKLAEEFDSVAVPDYGKYVKH